MHVDIEGRVWDVLLEGTRDEVSFHLHRFADLLPSGDVVRVEGAAISFSRENNETKG